MFKDAKTLFSSKTLTASWLNVKAIYNPPKDIFFTVQYEQIIEEFRL